MTERPNDAPGDDLEQPTELAEEAPDLTDAELSAATEDAEFEVEESEELAVETEEGADEEAEADEGEPAEEAAEVVVATAAAPLGARARAEQARARARAEERGAREPRAARTPFPIDPSLRIKDPSSTIFVAGTILVFLLIFLNAMAFGHGGAFSPTHPPATPQPSVSAVPSSSPGASGSAAPGSPVPSPAASAPAGSAAPSSTP